MWERERERDQEGEGQLCPLLISFQLFSSSSNKIVWGEFPPWIWSALVVDVYGICYTVLLFIVFKSVYWFYCSFQSIQTNNKLTIWCKVFGRLSTIVCHPNDFKKCFYRIGITVLIYLGSPFWRPSRTVNRNVLWSSTNRYCWDGKLYKCFQVCMFEIRIRCRKNISEIHYLFTIWK